MPSSSRTNPAAREDEQDHDKENTWPVLIRCHNRRRGPLKPLHEIEGSAPVFETAPPRSTPWSRGGANTPEALEGTTLPDAVAGAPGAKAVEWTARLSEYRARLEDFEDRAQRASRAAPSATTPTAPELTLVVRNELRQFLDDALAEISCAPPQSDDPTYLDLWLAYAKLQAHPAELFRFLFRRKVGLGSAALYLAFAEHLRERSRLKDAINVLSLGIHRHAKPVESLRRALADFREEPQSTSHENSLTDALSAITINEAEKFKQSAGKGHSSGSLRSSPSNSTSAKPKKGQRTKSSTSKHMPFLVHWDDPAGPEVMGPSPRPGRVPEIWVTPFRIFGHDDSLSMEENRAQHYIQIDWLS